MESFVFIVVKNNIDSRNFINYLSANYVKCTIWKIVYRQPFGALKIVYLHHFDNAILYRVRPMLEPILDIGRYKTDTY